jgi:uncharacterized protein YciI
MEKKIFVVVLRYLVDIETINAARASHLEFLKQYYDTGGVFLLWKTKFQQWRHHSCSF